MKTTQQIVGLPVISISDGNEIGMVKNVIINAAKGTVDFFVIDSGGGLWREVLFLPEGFLASVSMH